MALLPESCCSRDLASYCGEEKAGDLCADVPRTHTGSHPSAKAQTSDREESLAASRCL